MKNTIRRFARLCAVALALVFLAGCAQIQVFAGIGADYTTRLAYALAIDLGGVEEALRPEIARKLFSIVSEYGGRYQFKVEHVTTYDRLITRGENIFSCTLAKTQEHQSYQQAFNTLTEWLLDESITPFTSLNALFEDAGAQSVISVEGTLDLYKFIQFSNLEDFPPTVRQMISDSIENTMCTLQIVLPATEVENASAQFSLQDNLVEMQADLSLTQANPIDLTALYTQAGGVTGPSGTVLSHFYTLAAVFGALALLAAGFGVFAICRMCKNRTAKSNACAKAPAEGNLPPATPEEKEASTNEDI